MLSWLIMGMTQGGYVFYRIYNLLGMTKYRKGPTKEHYTGPQRIGNTARDHKGALHRTTEDRQIGSHEKTARLTTILCNFKNYFIYFL